MFKRTADSDRISVVIDQALVSSAYSAGHMGSVGRRGAENGHAIVASGILTKIVTIMEYQSYLNEA